MLQPLLCCTYKCRTEYLADGWTPRNLTMDTDLQRHLRIRGMWDLLSSFPSPLPCHSLSFLPLSSETFLASPRKWVKTTTT